MLLLCVLKTATSALPRHPKMYSSFEYCSELTLSPLKVGGKCHRENCACRGLGNPVGRTPHCGVTLFFIDPLRGPQMPSGLSRGNGRNLTPWRSGGTVDLNPHFAKIIYRTHFFMEGVLCAGHTTTSSMRSTSRV